MKRRTIHAFSVAAAILYPWIAVSNPAEPAVKSGSASFQNMDGSTLHIQTADGTVIHWNSFSIDQHETTRFILPGPNAAVLNRVTGGLSSAIAGILESNGRVYLINPNGILIDKTGVINTASFFASTLDALDSEFLAGRDIVWKGDSKAAILNLGTINAREGDLYLIGYKIENQGTLSAGKGVVGIGAGSEVLLSMEGDQRILIRPRGGEGVVDSGYIEAMQAEIRADGSSYAQAINHSGKIQALGVEEKGGRIYLVAEGAEVRTSGEFTAEEVQILGKGVALVDQAKIHAAGGTVLVGGDYQGANPDIPNSEVTFVDKDVRIDVSATANGDGGTVILWSDGGCQFLGHIDARGGTVSGDGGFVEVSGKQYLNFKGLVDTRAPLGKTGTLLLDPTNIVISAAASTGQYLYNPASSTFQYLSSIDDAAAVITNLLHTDITTQLMTNNLVIQSVTDTLQSTAIALGLSAGDITLIDGVNIIDPAATLIDNNLTLNAAHNIYLHGQILFPNVAGVGSQGDVNLIAGADIILGPHAAAASTTAPRIFIDGATSGHGNISLTAGKSVRISNNFTAALPAAGGLSTAAGSISVTALDGDVTFTTGTVTNTSVEVLSTLHTVSITANNGKLNVLGGNPAAGTSTVAIQGNTGVNANATLGLNLIGGGTANSTATISSAAGDVVIKSAIGDLNIRGGTGVTTGASITAATNLTLEATQGNILIQGGSGATSGASVSATTGDVSVSAFGGGGITLIAGNVGATSNAAIAGTRKVSVNATNGNLDVLGAAAATSQAFIFSSGTVDFTVGRNCTIRGGTGGSPTHISGTNGLDGNILGSLTVQGGGTTGGSCAYILNFAGNLNLSVDGNMNLLAGTASTCYAQIGSSEVGANTSNIAISRVGGNVTLTGTQTAAQASSYAVIGHGSTSAVGTAISGDITFASGIGGDLILTSGVGTNTNNFAQIGHFGGTLATDSITSNIRINEVGNNTILSPGSDYAVIGHGTNNTNATAITGDIYVNSTIGSCIMRTGNAAVENVFSQIGHVRGTTIIGDITVNLGGSLSMRTTDSSDSASLIGHGNTATTASSFAGLINVNASDLLMIGGNAALAMGGVAAPISQIGFYSGLTVRGSIVVETEGDIVLLGGSPTVGSGNAIIGYVNYNPAVSASFDNITVRSIGGSINLTGGSGLMGSTISGQATIGLLQDVLAPDLFESRILVDCPNGTLALNGLPVDTTTFTDGYATIQNGLVSISPYDVVINAGTVVLNGAGTDATHRGTAVIGSRHNLTIRTANDLIISPDFGIATIGGVSTTCDYVFDIGNDLILTNGTGAAASIFSPMGLPGQRVTMKYDIGHDLILRSSISAQTFIGPDPTAGMSAAAQTLAMDFTIGHDLILIGSTGATVSSARIAAFPMAASDQNFTLRFDIGGNALLQSGTGMAASAIIGPTGMNSPNQFADIGMKVAGDLNLVLGVAGVTTDALIGSPSMIASSQILNVGLDIGGSLILNGSSASSSFCQIGPASMAGGVAAIGQIFTFSSKVGGDLTLIGSSGTTTVTHIGPQIISTDNATSTMAFDVGGDLSLIATSGGSSTASIGTTPTGGGLSGSNILFSIDCISKGDLLLQGGFDIANTNMAVGIGPNSMSGTDQNCRLFFDIGGDAMLLSGRTTSPMGGANALIGPNTMSALREHLEIEMKVGGDLSLILGADGTGNNARIGFADMTNDEQNLIVGLEVSGNLILDGGNSVASFCQIGPQSMSGARQSTSISAASGLDVRLIGGVLGSCVVNIGPTSIGGNQATATVSVIAGGDLTLIGGTGTDSPVSIGTSPVAPGAGISGMSSILTVDCSAGADFLLRGRNMNSMALIGPNMVSGQSSISTTRIHADGNGALYGGPNINAIALIGPQNVTSLSSPTSVQVSTGGDLSLYPGSGGGNALIGATNMTGLNETLSVSVVVGQTLLMDGSAGSNTCQIGPLSNTMSGQIVDISLSTGRDLIMVGCVGASAPTAIGLTSFSGASNQNATISLNIGGNLNMLGGTVGSPNAYIGIDTFAGGGTTVVGIDLTVGDSVFMKGQGTPIYIGGNSMGMASTENTLLVSMSLGNDLRMIADSSSSYIGISSMLASHQNVGVSIQGGRDLYLETPNAGTGNVIICSPTMSMGLNQNLSLALDFGGNVTMKGNGPQISVGSPTMAAGMGSSRTATVGMKVGGDLLMQLGTAMALNNIFFAAPSMGGQSDMLTMSLDVGGNAVLHGGSAMTSFCQIGPQSMSSASQILSMDATIGGNLQLIGSGGLGTEVLIGPNTIGPGGNITANLHITTGGDLTVLGGTTMSSTAAIGTSTAGTGITSQNSTFLIDCDIGGDFLIQGGTGMNATALVGPRELGAVMAPLSTTKLKAGGNGAILGGSTGSSSPALVGPQTIGSIQSNTIIEVITGNNLLISAGAMSCSALIGGANMINGIESLSISVDVGNTLTMTGGNGMTSFCQIGPISNTSQSQLVDINVNTGKDLVLIAGPILNSNTSIGPTSFSFMMVPSNQVAMLSFDIGGDLLIEANNGTNARAYIGMDVFGDAAGNGNLLSIDMNVGGSVQFQGENMSNPQNYIGAQSMSAPNSTLAMTLVLGHDLRMMRGANGNFIGSNTMSGLGSSVNIDIQGGGDLLIQGPTASANGRTFIGPIDMSANEQTASIHLDFKGNVSLQGSQLTSGQEIYIGPRSTGGGVSGRKIEVDLSCGGDFLMQGGIATNNSVFFASPFTFSGTNDQLIASLRIGGSATLAGGSTDTGFCQIGPQNMSAAFQKFSLNMDVGQDLRLVGASGGAGTTEVLIGVRTMNNLNQTAQLSFDIGGNLSIQGGADVNSSAIIGTSINAAMGLIGNQALFSIDCNVGGDLLLQGGTGMGSSALLGVTTSAGTSQILTTTVNVGGSAIVSGLGINSVAQIGPQSFTTTQTDATVALTVGHDLLMTVGSAMGSAALIGSPTMTGNNEKLTVSVAVGDTLIVDGTGGSASCMIGPLSNTVNDQFSAINVSTGKDLILLAGMSNLNPTAIGFVSFSAAGGGGATNQVGTVAIDVGGNAILRPGLGGLSYIGMDGFAGESNTLTVDMKVAESILMQGTNGSRSFIGANTMSGANNFLQESIAIGHSLQIVEGNSGMFIGTTSMSAINQKLEINLQIDQDLFIHAPMSPILGNFIGPRTMTIGPQTAFIHLDVGGNATLLGANTTLGTVGGQAFIGPLSMGGGANHIATIGMNVGGNFHMQAGGDATGAGNSVFLASPTMSGAGDQMLLNLTVGGSIELNGGTTDGSMTPAFCQIGPQTMSGSQEIYQLNIKAGGDLIMIGSSGSTTKTRIGPSSVILPSGIGTISLDLGGDLLLQGGSGLAATVQIGAPFANSTATNDIDIVKARNIIVTGGTGAGSFALIGMGPSTSLNGDIHIGQILGDVTIGPSGIFGGVALGLGSFAQIGHVGTSGSPGSLNGDIIIDQIGGVLTLRAGGLANTSAIIGHDNQTGDVADTVTGRISIHAGAAQLIPNTGSISASAVIGFDPPTGMGFTLTSPLVELICERDIALTAAGNGGKAVIGYYDSVSTSANATINNINVTAERGNITLTGASSAMGSSGFAVIGTLASTGVTQSNIKVTAGRDLILTATGSGGARIVNNQTTPPVANGAYHITIDPASVILLSGPAIGRADIYSSGNLTLNFDDRLDINYDAASSGATLQSGFATVIAGSDLFINTSTPSSGSINIEGTSNGATTEIASLTGAVYIGTATAPGAGNINVGFSVASIGVARIRSVTESKIHAGGTVALRAGSMGGASSITSNGNIGLIADNSLTLLGSGATTSSISSTAGSINLTVRDTLFLDTNSNITTTASDSHIYIDPISVIVLESTISSAGNLTLLFDDRLDINFDAAGGVVQGASASVIAAGDIFINQSPLSYGVINIQGAGGAFTSEIQSTGGSVFIGTPTSAGAGDINVGIAAGGAVGTARIISLNETQINAAGNVNVQGDGTSQITSTGNIHLLSGNNISVFGNGLDQITSTNGSLFLSAAASVTGSVNGTYSALGSITIDAGLDLIINSNATFLSSGSGDLRATVGRDFTLSSLVASSSVGGDLIVNAGRNVTVASTATFPGVGVIDLVAGRSVISQGVITNGTGTISMTAGEDVLLQGGSVTSAGAIDFQADRNVTNSIAVSLGGTGDLEFAAGETITNTGTVGNGTGALRLTAGTDISLVGGSVASSGSVHMNADRNITNSATASVTGNGNMVLVAGQLVQQFGTLNLFSTGTLSITAGEDFNLTGLLNSSAAGFTGGDIYVSAARDINMTGGTMTTNGTHPIYAIAGNNFVANNNGLVPSTVSQSGNGEIVLIAGRDMNLNGTTAILSPNRGFITLVVDNLFPDFPKYGRGFFTLAAGASVNNAGGEIRLFTARQPFNTISGLLNGVPFVPGAVYVDSTTETWLSYYYRSFVGVNYMVFYKDGPTTVPPVPPVPPIVPVVPVTPGVAAAIVFNVPFKTINLFWRATAEAFRDWAVYDEFLFDLDSFETVTQCPKIGGGDLLVSDGKITSGTSATGCTPGTLAYEILKQKYRNYHTKKLDNRY